MSCTYEELKYPEWQMPLHEVILEIDRKQLEEKAQKAEAAIVKRLREVQQAGDRKDEREALRFGLSLLKSIKCERLGYPDVQ